MLLLWQNLLETTAKSILRTEIFTTRRRSLQEVFYKKALNVCLSLQCYSKQNSMAGVSMRNLQKFSE